MSSRRIDARSMAMNMLSRKLGRSDGVVRVDITNPTSARRVVNVGIKLMPHVTIEPGETKSDIDVARWVAEDLRASGLKVKFK